MLKKIKNKTIWDIHGYIQKTINFFDIILCLQKMTLNKINFLIVMSFCLSSKLTCEGSKARELHNRYNDVALQCFDADNKTRPAYECSGLLIRGVNIKEEMKFVWNFKRIEHELKSFPLAFLRRDQLFFRFPRYYSAGYIMYPHLKIPRGKSIQPILCAFPADAGSSERDARGCGQSIHDSVGTSKPCDAQNIVSFPQWLSHYEQIIASDHPNFQSRQCGFNMTKNTATRDFALALAGKIYLWQHPSNSSLVNNELRMENWDENNAKTIPIEAFWYLSNSFHGLLKALKYQRDFYFHSGGELVPIVSVKLAKQTNPNQYAQFIDLKSQHYGFL